MYTVSRIGRVESEEMGDVHCIKGRERGVRIWVMYTVSRAGRGESEKLGGVHGITGRER